MQERSRKGGGDILSRGIRSVTSMHTIVVNTGISMQAMSGWLVYPRRTFHGFDIR